MKKITIIITCIIVYSSAFSQNISWNFSKKNHYNGDTKKNNIDSNVQDGTISLVEALRSFLITENGKLFYISFNSMEAISRGEDYFKYELSNNSKGKTSFTTITYYKDNSAGTFTYSEGKSFQTFFITADSTISPDQFYYLSDSSLNNLHFEWLKICSGYNGEIYFVYRTKLPDRDGIIKIWEMDYLPSYQYKKVVFKNVERKALIRINCMERKMLIEEVHYYDSNNKIITSMQSLNEDWNSIIPGTLGDEFISKVCKLYIK